jgi:hypothetical protein
MTLQSSVQLTLAANIALTPNVIVASQATLSQQLGWAMTNGTGAGQADLAWFDSRTLSASSSETIDFAGTLRDPLNTLISMARLKALVISAAAGNTNNVVVGGGATTITTLFGATTHTTALRPGETVAWFSGSNDATGKVITSGSADLLQIANSGAGTTVGYTIAAIGCSA